MPERRLDASALRHWAGVAVVALGEHAAEINRLNVFPVADRDTGTNMLFTMRAARAEAGLVCDGADLAAVAAALSRGAATGARGNSGVLLSQILRAVADVAADAPADGAAGVTGAVTGSRAAGVLDTAALASALHHAVTLTVAAMGGAVVAGTMVSVLQAAAGALARAADRGATPGPALADAGAAAAAALERTPAQLPVLAEAGVVDAGGLGLLVLIDALTETVGGRSQPRRRYRPAAPTVSPAAARGAPDPTGFEVMYLVGPCTPDVLDRLRGALAGLGDSVLIAPADAGAHSVHVHTGDAGAAVEAGLAAGPVSRIRISALASGRVAPGGWERGRAVLAVVDGDGAEYLFGSEGATVLRAGAGAAGGVSAAELLQAVIDTGAAQVMVLPNGYVRAEELVAGCTAGIASGIDVVPVPAASMVQGLAALAVHDPDREAVEDGYAMARAAAGTRHGSVRVATEAALTWSGPCRAGDALGIAGNEVLVVDGDIGAAAARLTDLLLGAGGELVTVLVGAEAPDGLTDLLAGHVRRHHPGTEFTGYRTGQHGDVALVGVE